MGLAREVRDFIGSYSAMRKNFRDDDSLELKRQALADQKEHRKAALDLQKQRLGLAGRSQSSSESYRNKKLELDRDLTKAKVGYYNRRGIADAPPIEDFGGATGGFGAKPAAPAPAKMPLKPMPDNMPAPGTLKTSELEDEDDAGGTAVAAVDGDDDDDVEGSAFQTADFDMSDTLDDWGLA